jgi:ribosomal protein L29
MKEYQNKTTAEINKIVSEKREELRKFRFGNAGSKSKNVKEGRTIRKDIARALTAMSLARLSAKTTK